MCDENKNYCRICLDVESYHVSILGDPTINLHLRACLAIIVSSNDHLSKNICSSCVSKLSQFYHFQLHARYTQDWLESTHQTRSKKNTETKTPIQPLPDSEYNSDSLLEFLNNTANIEDYLNNLGKEDIPSIVNMLDKNEHALELAKVKTLKQPSPKKKENKNSSKIDMEIDVLDSDIEIVKEIIMKEGDTVKPSVTKVERNFSTCYGCKLKFDSIQKLCQHVSICDNACRTCVKCDTLFDSRQKMIEHSAVHLSIPLTCNCGTQFTTTELLLQHQKTCRVDLGANFGCTFKCKECGDTFKDRFQLYRHARQHIIKSEEKTCEICGHIFIGNDALAKHKRKEHDESKDKMYRCKVCNLTLTDHQQMYQHVKTHTLHLKPEPTRHLCESCGKSFATRVILSRHSLQHNDNYKCTVCGKRFRCEKEKDDHALVHNDVAMCEKCGKTFNCYQLDGHPCV